MESNNFEEYEFETVEIESARDAVLKSFLVQESLTALDLCACESSLMLRPFFTEEQYRNSCDPRRRILYRLHLDLPRYMQRSLRIAEPYEEGRYLRHRPTFNMTPISVSEYLYNRDLAPDIVNVICLANNKTEELRRYMNVMKLLKLDQHVVMSAFIFNKLIHVLYPDCQDSNLVVEFAETFILYSRILLDETPDVVGYILEHARRLRCDIFASLGWSPDPINACIVFNRTENISKLLEYGTAFIRKCQIYMLNLEYLVSSRISAEETTEPRMFFLTQLLFVLMYNRSSWPELQRIWRSIPDPYLSANEIYFAFGGLMSSESVYAIINYNYFQIVEENVQSSNLVPRPLCHLCRVTVRNILSRNFHLPHGISQLGMPPLLENYLNLRC